MTPVAAELARRLTYMAERIDAAVTSLFDHANGLGMSEHATDAPEPPRPNPGDQDNVMSALDCLELKIAQLRRQLDRLFV